MERLRERLSTFLHARDQKRMSIQARWMRSCLLPAALIIAIAVAALSIFARLTMPERASMIFLFAFVIGLAILAAFGLVGMRFIGGINQSLWRLQNQAQSISEGRYGIRTEKLRDDELGDLTERINEMSKDISRSNTLQSEFISSVSHELRTPLTAIMGWAEAMAYDEAIQGDSRRGLEIIYKEASRLTKMVSELLDFTRIQDGRFTLNIEPVDIAAELEDVLYAYQNLLQREEVKLHYECKEEEIPMIDGDPERLRQVFLNILDNAAKYGRDGGKVEVSLTTEGDSVVIQIRDHGPGIPEDELPHVKKRFYKGSSKERGSGIGLAVCEEIVNRHGGKLLIENGPEDGVIVTVRLPVKQSV